MNDFILSTAVALGIGLLIGMERERSKGMDTIRDIAGVRTFPLVAVLGLFGSMLDDALVLGVFGLLVGAVGIAGYLRTRDSDPGVTTEIALLTTFALGALCLNHPAYSAGCAVVLTVLLAARPWLHDVVKSRLSDREMHDGLLLAAAALVVLPLLPDRTIDPWEVFNPRRIWVVVVMVMALNAAGYVGLRLWGPARGLMLAGILGGLVSSASTHGAMGHRARSHPELSGSAAAAATFSSVTTALFLLGVVSAVNPALGLSLAPACIASAIAAALVGIVLLFHANAEGNNDIDLGRPLSLRAALIFGFALSAVLMGSTLLLRFFGPQALVAGTAVAGFADAHSPAISAAVLARNDLLSFEAAQAAVLLGFSTNALTKIVVSRIAGPPSYALRIAIAVACSVAAAWAAWWLLPIEALKR